MRYYFFGACVVLAVLAVGVASAADMTEIFNAMNWEDKCGQMTQIAYDVVDNRPFDEANPINMTKLRIAIQEKFVGSILNAINGFAVSKTTWAAVIKAIQDMALETRHGIPVIYGIDSIHGANYIQEATIFPQPLSAAATFNAELVSKIGHITSVETRTVGIPWNFNPVLDVGRQSLWPRIYETFGEDTRVCELLGTAYIRGHQGNNDFTNRNNTATCLKHYIGYSLPVNGRDRTNALIPERLLRETFLPPFEAGVKAASPTVMINSASVNGIPGHTNSFYINDILKGELKFDGLVVSDWSDIVNIYTRDKIAETMEEAVRIGVMAGVDMSMVPMDYSFFDHCVSLTKKDKEFQARVNDATMRILNVKNKLGLFEGGLAYADEANLDIIGNAEFEAVNLEAARESIVLAKNDGSFLPLTKTSTQNILVTGPTGNLLRVFCGGWTYTWQGEKEAYYKQFGRRKLTLFDAINQKATPGGYSVTYQQGVDFNDDAHIDEAVAAAGNVDLIVLAIGEDTYTENQGNTDTLMLDRVSKPVQMTLARRLLSLDKPVVVVYIGGRPRVITEIAEHVNTRAVLIGLLPGTRGSEAIADIFFGDYNPNGRLPITYPKSPNGFTTYDMLALENSSPNKYFFLYPFGHGLSYTNFTYSGLKVKLINDDTVSVSVTVQNTGQRSGKETVILYINDAVASVTRPIRQVKGFEKIELTEGATRTVQFTLDRWRDLSFIGRDNVRIVEPGTFNVYVDSLTAPFVLPAGEPPVKTTVKPNTAHRTLKVESFLALVATLLFNLAVTFSECFPLFY